MCNCQSCKKREGQRTSFGESRARHHIHGRDVFFRKDVAREGNQHARFADSAIANNDGFYRHALMGAHSLCHEYVCVGQST